jgi:hypothetical protein
LVRVEGRRHWAVVAVDAHDEASTRAAWVRGYVKSMGLPEARRAPWTAESVPTIVDQTVRTAPDVVFVWTEAEHAADLISALRTAESASWVVVGPDALRPEFASRIGGAPEGILAMPPACGGLTRNAETIVTTALHSRTVAATNHLLSAVQRSPQDRESVRRALLEMEEDPFGERHPESDHPPHEPLRIARLTPRGWEYETVPAAADAGRP